MDIIKIIYCAILVVNFSYLSNAARILGIFQTPSYSHQIVYRPLMKALSERGHQLTIITTNPSFHDHPNITEIDLSESYEVYNKILNYVKIKEKQMSSYNVVKLFTETILAVSDHQLRHPKVHQLAASDNKFDLIILEYFSFSPMLAFAEVFNCSVIGITSMDTSDGVHEMMGNSVNPAVIPESLLFPWATGQLSFFQRFKSTLFYVSWKYVLQPIMNDKLMEQVHKHFPDVKSSQEDLEKRLQMLMVTANPLIGMSRPLSPNTIQLRMMHIEPPKELPNSDLKTFLDNSKYGVIYMSLGTNVKSKDFNPAVRKIFLNVFQKLKYDILWKFEDEILPGKPKNVKISKWLPQPNVLSHPNVKLFICQGGQQSLEEAIDRTVPVLGIPFVGEQEGNVMRMVRNGVAQFLDFHEINEKSLMDAINETLKLKYKKNITKLRKLIHDQPMTSLESAVWWTEYVIRNNGTKDLFYSGRDVPCYQKFMLDIFAFIAFIAYLTYKLIKFINQLKFKKSKVD